MPSVEFSAPGLIPIEQIPPAAAFGVRAYSSSVEGISMLFPKHNLDARLGVLGDYVGKEPAEDSLLHSVQTGVETYRSSVFAWEEAHGGTRNAITRKALSACHVWVELISSIDLSYQNLASSHDPLDATIIIREELADRAADKAHHYNAEYERLCSTQNRWRAGDFADYQPVSSTGPVLDFGELMGNPPASAEVRQEEAMECIQGQLNDIDLLLKRLRFERASAWAILELTEEVYVPRAINELIESVAA